MPEFLGERLHKSKGCKRKLQLAIAREILRLKRGAASPAPLVAAPLSVPLAAGAALHAAGAAFFVAASDAMANGGRFTFAADGVVLLSLAGSAAARAFVALLAPDAPLTMVAARAAGMTCIRDVNGRVSAAPRNHFVLHEAIRAFALTANPTRFAAVPPTSAWDTSFIYFTGLGAANGVAGSATQNWHADYVYFAAGFSGLVALDDNGSGATEFFVRGNTVTFSPRAGDVILFDPSITRRGVARPAGAVRWACFFTVRAPLKRPLEAEFKQAWGARAAADARLLGGAVLHFSRGQYDDCSAAAAAIGVLGKKH